MGSAILAFSADNHFFVVVYFDKAVCSSLTLVFSRAIYFYL